MQQHRQTLKHAKCKKPVTQTTCYMIPLYMTDLDWKSYETECRLTIDQSWRIRELINC